MSIPSITTNLPAPVRLPRWRGILDHFINLAQRAGNLLRTVTAPYHLATDCGGGSAPCACNWPTGLSPTYTVNGWQSLAPCPSCDNSTDAAWDGSLHHTGPGCVWWAADPAFDPLSINGKSLDIAYTQILLRTSSPCRWELYIACTSVATGTAILWYGYKSTGPTPAGAYTLAGSDCANLTPTMTVA